MSYIAPDKRSQPPSSVPSSLPLVFYSCTLSAYAKDESTLKKSAIAFFASFKNIPVFSAGGCFLPLFKDICLA